MTTPVVASKLPRVEEGTLARQIHVVGAVIIKDGLVLCAQRGAMGVLPGLWEFPGGKIEPGETPRVALQREIAEELRCTVEVGEEATTTTYEYEFGVVTLTTFYCRLVAGSPQLTEHATIKWLAPAELEMIDWAPADIPAVEQIKANLGR